MSSKTSSADVGRGGARAAAGLAPPLRLEISDCACASNSRSTGGGVPVGEGGTGICATRGAAEQCLDRLRPVLPLFPRPIYPVSEEAEDQGGAGSGQRGMRQPQRSGASSEKDREESVTENAGAGRDELIHGRRNGLALGIGRTAVYLSR